MIDVIIPYYNDRKGLTRCLSSFLSQTISVGPEQNHVKVHIIDDCSPESVDDLIDFFSSHLNLDYVKLESNQKYPGLVRQYGIDHTSEPYLMFVDSDDILSNVAIDTALKAIAESPYPFIQGYFTQQVKDQNKNLVYINKSDEITWLHGNIYRRSFLELYNIKFPKGYNEDMAFNILCKMYCLPNGICKTNMYYWLYNEHSLTRNKKSLYYNEGHKDYVYNLMTSYTTLIQEITDTNKRPLLSAQIGCSMAVFFEFLSNNAMKCNKETEKLNFIKLFFDTFSPFSNVVNSLINEGYETNFKEGFLTTFQTRNFETDPIMSMNEFLEKCHLNIHCEPDDYRLIQKKNI